MSKVVIKRSKLVRTLRYACQCKCKIFNGSGAGA